MIFQRAIRRELLSTAGAVFTTLFTIVITVMLIRILGDAASGKVSSADVVALLGFSALNYLPVILTLTVFISVLLVVARSYQDSEMVVWFASGLSLMQWIRPVMTVGLPIVMMIAVLSLMLTPWANGKSAEFKERFKKREDISRVSPGKFQESALADRIFFVEGLSADATKVKNVFVSQSNNKEDIVVASQQGEIIFDDRGDKFLILDRGRRYDGKPGESAFQIMDFQRYGILIASKAEQLVTDKSTRALPTLILWKTPTKEHMSELLWRIGLPLMGLLLMLLAIPLGFVNPRRGRTLNLMIALLLAVSYSNALGIMQAAVAQGKLPWSWAWWPLHAVGLITIALLFAWRNNTNSRWHPVILLVLVKKMLFARRPAST
jgi:lipopolysaccharide export system permease protein